VVTYGVPERTTVELAVFDVAGRRVATLVAGDIGPGTHEAVWNGKNDRGEDVASGVYFCRLQALGEEHSRKMVLMK
jgi:flagellar hook assembly protein FlgD